LIVTRLIAIGDIHGCSLALAALVEAIRPTAEDVIVPLGDYIDRGIDSRGALDQLIELSTRCHLVPLLGNHEEMLLAARSDAWSLQWWLACGGLATLDSYGCDARLHDIPPKHWAFLQRCQKIYETDTHVFAHAKENFRLPTDPEDGRPLWPVLTGKIGIVGHTAQQSGEILDEGSWICVDTYCHGGGWLTALDVTAGQIWQADERGHLRTGGMS
jgi:serine/threonine protein phosphatase 1